MKSEYYSGAYLVYQVSTNKKRIWSVPDQTETSCAAGDVTKFYSEVRYRA